MFQGHPISTPSPSTMSLDSPQGNCARPLMSGAVDSPLVDVRHEAPTVPGALNRIAGASWVSVMDHPRASLAPPNHSRRRREVRVPYRELLPSAAHTTRHERKEPAFAPAALAVRNPVRRMQCLCHVALQR
ncbi:hypothetical protein GQ54DRAFT_323341, partial [Martensiomyces pterosporus]